jgi:hypothetical protein
MRIFHVAEVRGIGGLQNWVLGLAKAQQQMGHEVTVILPPDTSNNWSLHTDIPEIPIKMWNLTYFQDADIVHSYAGLGHGIPCLKSSTHSCQSSILIMVRQLPCFGH